MPSNITKTLLQRIIMQETRQVLLEQEDAAAGSEPLDLDLGGSELDTAEVPADDDLGAGDDAGGMDDDLGGDDADALGDDGMDSEGGGGEGDDSLDGEGGDMDFGGGFGGAGGGFGGGGGGLGGGDDAGGEGDDADAEGEAGDATESEAPQDPVQGTLEAVKEAQAGTDDAEPVQNPQELTAVAKAHIQDKFTNFSDPNVQALISLMSSDPDQTIQDVGRRLSMFVRGF